MAWIVTFAQRAGGRIVLMATVEDGESELVNKLSLLAEDLKFRVQVDDVPTEEKGSNRR